jgi:hypothetical protein
VLLAQWRGDGDGPAGGADDDAALEAAGVDPGALDVLANGIDMDTINSFISLEVCADSPLPFPMHVLPWPWRAVH